MLQNPDPPGGAYSAPPHPIADGEGGRCLSEEPHPHSQVCNIPRVTKDSPRLPKTFTINYIIRDQKMRAARSKDEDGRWQIALLHQPVTTTVEYR